MSDPSTPAEASPTRRGAIGVATVAAAIGISRPRPGPPASGTPGPHQSKSQR